MPTYDYKCADCSHVFETVHGVDDTAECCPECGGKVSRLFHPVGIIFKGSGFYKTDNRSASGNGGGKPSTESTEKVEKELEKVKEKGPDKKEKTPKEKVAGD